MTDGTIITTTEYMDTSTALSTGSFQYTNSKLDFFAHTSTALSTSAEGYVKATLAGLGRGTSYAFDYIFNYIDHLGNIRVKHAQNPANGNQIEILEEDHYYPYGLKCNGYSTGHMILTKDDGPRTGVVLTPVNPFLGDSYKYKFGGKEYDDTFNINTYDFGARNYDPALGRWMNIDPLAEAMRRHSPYNYAFDNPVYFIDPDGMMPTDSYGMGTATGAVDVIGGFDVNTLDENENVIATEYHANINDAGNAAKGIGKTIFENQVKTAFGDKTKMAAEKTSETVYEVIDNIPLLKQNDASDTKITISEDYVSKDNDHKGANALTYEHNNIQYITIFGKSFSSYLFLAQTLFHEYVHVIDFRSGWRNNTFNKFCEKNYSEIEALTITGYLMEIRAYRIGEEVTGLQSKYSQEYKKAERALTNRGINF